MNDIIITDTSVSKNEIERLSKGTFGDMVKAVVDINKKIVGFGGELHADIERILLDQGSNQYDLWGINVYPALPRDQWIEFDSMVNIRPSQGNRSRSVEDANIQQKICEIVNTMIIE